jgi:hypothetical protein
MYASQGHEVELLRMSIGAPKNFVESSAGEELWECPKE